MHKESRNRPQFLSAEHDTFFNDLKNIVRDYIHLNSKYVYLISGIKSIFLISCYLFLYYLILNSGNNLPLLFASYGLMGIVVIMVFLNVIHPAAHQALFRSKKLNGLCQHIFEFLGTSSYLWRMKHVRLHHPYANIPNWDCDIEQSDIIKIFPDARHFWYHRYQYIYGPFMYLMYTLIWIFYRDFRDIFDRNRIVNKTVKVPRSEVLKLIIVKLFYIFYIIVVPYLLLDVRLINVITGFFLMHFLASGLGLIALVSTHVGEDCKWTYVAADGKVNQTWAYHQLISANDFSTTNPVSNFVFGHFNHHVAHHLFPSVNPELYVGVTKLIKDYAEKHNLPYRCFSIRQTLHSHYKLLRSNSYELNFDADL